MAGSARLKVRIFRGERVLSRLCTRAKSGLTVAEHDHLAVEDGSRGQRARKANSG